MAIVIFSLGLTVVNGIVKSVSNTANSLSNFENITVFDITSRNKSISPSFFMKEDVTIFNLKNIEHFVNESYRSSKFYEEKQKFLTASYTKYDEAVLQEIDRRLTKDDLVIFVHPLAMKLYLKANPNSEVKKLIQIHGNYLEEVDNYNLIKEHFDEIDYVQTVSKYMREDLIDILNAPKDKTIFIPNIAVPVKIDRVKHRYLKRISIIGSIQKRKNQLDAVKVLEYIEDNNVVLQIYGHELDKEYTQYIKEYIERKNLGHRVLFKGLAEEQEIYANSDMVILTSEHEGLPYIFFESAMYDIPVLAYDFKYGAKEFSQDGENGCLFEMGDYKSMAKKINDIFENRELYDNIVKMNREHFNNTYAEDKIVQQYLSLLGENSSTFNLDDLSKDNKAIDVLKMTKKDISLEVTDTRWGIEEKLVKDYYLFEFQLKNFNSKEDRVFYIYKKRKFYIDFTTQNEDSIKNNFLFISPKRINKDEITITCKIEKKNRFSNDLLINKFYIGVESNGGRENYIGYIDKNGNYEFISNLQLYYPNKIGIFKINELEHILLKDGLWIRYPKNEHISKITDENNSELLFDTQYRKYYGKYILFFKVKSGIFNKLNIVMNSGDKCTIDFSEFTYKKVFKQIEQIEQKYDLYSMKINDIYIWELIRVEIFEKILENVGVLNKHFTKIKAPKEPRYKGKKTIWGIPDCARLVIEFPRKKEKDYRTVALHDEDSIILEYPQDGFYTESSYDEKSNVFPIQKYLEHYKNMKISVNFSKEDKQKIIFLKDIFKNELGVEIEYSIFVKGRIEKFKKEFSFFNKLFKEKKIDEIVIPSSYWSAGIVYAAKINNVIASDIQYALISKYHPSYSFPKFERNYQADRIYLWSKYWNIKEVPFNKSIVTKTNYFVEKCKDLNLFNNKNIYDYAFISQSRIGEKIIEKAFKFAKKNTNLKIVICPHPDEELDTYKFYNELLLLDNVVISSEETIVSISKSKHVVVVYSTSIFEALALEKDVSILKLNGYEVLEKEIKKGYVKLVDDVSKLLEKKENKKVDFMKVFYNYDSEKIKNDL